MKNEKASRLIKKVLNGSATPDEVSLLESWYIETADKQQDPATEPDYENIERDILHLLRAKQLKQPKPLWPRIAAAASVLIIMSIGLFYYQNKAKQVAAVHRNDIAPGTNKAFLVLGNGKRISLTDAANGSVAQQAGITISKASNGQVIYTVANAINPTDSAQYNTIETPKGGQYQVRLADGTSVWLNAASSLKFLTSFSNQKQRRVELTGEAYFEVAKNKYVPFIVKSARQEVKVLGTHFDVNSYADEANSKTTLLEGKVLVNGKTELRPGEQAVVSGSSIQVSEADTELAIAWKNNKFMFENADIESIMRMVSRWYNVDVVYEGPIPDDKFGGSVSRFDNVSKVLGILELTKNVHFKVDGRRITVTK